MKMTQMGLSSIWWLKQHTSTTGTTNCGGGPCGSTTTTTTKTTTPTSTSTSGRNQSPNCSYCLKKLLRILKKRSKMLLLCEATRPATFHCHYDPISYARNFDTTGCGSMREDDDYDYFYTFSSRFVAAPSSIAAPS